MSEVLPLVTSDFPPLLFERINFAGPINTLRLWRASVPGGWLLVTTDVNYSEAKSTLFIPDAGHEWRVGIY